MANQVGGDTDFGADFARGASIANMRAMRQERMIQLQGEQALQAVQERHLAAQADALVYQLQQAKAQKATDDADLENFNLSRHILKEQVDPMPGETPADTNARIDKATLTSLIAKNPKVGLQVVTAQNALEKPELAQAALTTRENVAQTQAAGKVGAAQVAATSREKIASSKAPNGYAPSVSEKDALALQRASDAVDQAYAEGDDAAIKKAEQFESDLRTAQERQHPDKIAVQEVQALRTELGTVLKEYWSGGRDPKLVPEIERLKGEIKVKAHPAKAGAPSAPAAAAAAPATAPQTRFTLDFKTGRLVPKKPAQP